MAHVDDAAYIEAFLCLHRCKFPISAFSSSNYTLLGRSTRLSVQVPLASVYSYKEEENLRYDSHWMEESIMGAPLLSSSASGVLELHHHHQALAHHLQGLAPLSTTQHMHASPDSNQVMVMDSKATSKGPLLFSKGKSSGTSDEDELSFMEGGDGQMGKSKRGSPWQRMKWTDSMVKLLINAVLYVGEDGVADSLDGNKKRKLGYLQKNGKWKSVSGVMMERGCYVSPQQCEDKFNDLNKRFKRLSDILGRNTAHCVVENPGILDEMDNLLPKVKEEAKKILSSKHLFYKEMCDYHNGCKSSMAVDFAEFQPSFHAGMLCKTQDLDAEEEDVEEDDEDDLDDQFEDMGVYPEFGGDGTTSTVEQRKFIRTRAIQLEERKVSLLAQALKLEKQRFKWQRFSSKKKRELKRMKLENERTKLENDRMKLTLKQRELETECRR